MPTKDLTEVAVGIFEGLSGSYERTLDIATLFQDRVWKRWLLETADIEPGDFVLDLGCGTCLLEEGMPSGQVVGVDVSEPMIRIGQAKALTRVRHLVIGDAASLPFRDSIFDKLLSCYVPKYTRVDSLSAETARVLKPGGSAVMYDFVRPKGRYSLFLAFYIYGVLHLAGIILGAARSRSAPTFRRLPEIVRSTNWDITAAESFSAKGLSGGRVSILTGGAAAGFVATKAPGT